MNGTESLGFRGSNEPVEAGDPASFWIWILRSILQKKGGVELGASVAPRTGPMSVGLS